MDVDYDELLKAVGLDFRKGSAGNYYQMCCPFAAETHKSKKDSNPSFVFYPSRNFARCYSCKVSFTTHGFLEACNDLNGGSLDLEFLEFYFTEEMAESEQLENIILSEAILGSLKKDHPKCLQYLKDRKIDVQYLQGVEILYDEASSRIVTPIRNSKGELVGATGRGIGSKRDHYHYFGVITGASLLGDQNRDNDKILWVEGYTDWLNGTALNNQLGAGFDVKATLTASLTDWQAEKLLEEEKAIFCGLDMDEAGLLAREKCLPKLLESVLLVNCRWKDAAKDVGNMSVEYFKEVFCL